RINHTKNNRLASIENSIKLITLEIIKTMKTQLLFAALFVTALGSAQTAIKNYKSGSDDLASDNYIENDHLLTLALPDYELAGNYSISGVLNNKLAGEVNSATIAYRVDNGKTVSERIAANALSRGTVVTGFQSSSQVLL